MKDISEIIRFFAELKLAEIKAQEEFLRNYLDKTQELPEAQEIEEEDDSFLFEDDQTLEEFMEEVDTVLEKPTEAPKSPTSPFETLLTNMDKEDKKTRQEAAEEATEVSYVFDFGKYKGKSLKSMDLKDLQTYQKQIEALIEEKEEKGENCSPKLGRFVKEAQKFVDSQFDSDIPF